MNLTEEQKAMLCAMQEEIEEQEYKIEKLQSERDQLHAENETLRRLLQRAVDFDEAVRLPHWATPGWVADSIEELARAEGSQK